MKPMDIFGDRWRSHIDRLESSWNDVVDPEDTVIIAGDIDWALRLVDAMETLRRIEFWPGKKILIRGNHDYWWSSKVTSQVRRALPPSLQALHNDCIEAEGFALCGAKGTPVPGAIDWTAENEKLLLREQQRLVQSLRARPDNMPTIAALHYPPFYPSQGPSPYSEILEEYGADVCVYGHLHGDSASSGPQGRTNGVIYRLVAGDAVDFRPVLLARNGRVVLESE